MISTNVKLFIREEDEINPEIEKMEDGSYWLEVETVTFFLEKKHLYALRKAINKTLRGK